LCRQSTIAGHQAESNDNQQSSQPAIYKEKIEIEEKLPNIQEIIEGEMKD